ncbi:hypothetical protein BDV95DRAFT_275347 [Massariosphaeria phaeospora]|uniref:Uncharacterized protein n=1 Tax=Massariosphaeria phaeospora TaxID=100035 RepID=A0A7C8MAJ6_9PLEO|nr:hypothetical protein BDV95DRAFT_275347 [Massariosphaeria phaeospora]
MPPSSRSPNVPQSPTLLPHRSASTSTTPTMCTPLFIVLVAGTLRPSPAYTILASALRCGIFETRRWRSRYVGRMCDSAGTLRLDANIDGGGGGWVWCWCCWGGGAAWLGLERGRAGLGGGGGLGMEEGLRRRVRRECVWVREARVRRNVEARALAVGFVSGVFFKEQGV